MLVEAAVDARHELGLRCTPVTAIVQRVWIGFAVENILRSVIAWEAPDRDRPARELCHDHTASLGIVSGAIIVPGRLGSATGAPSTVEAAVEIGNCSCHLGVAIISAGQIGDRDSAVDV